jgi:hypothetical protein
VRLRSRLVRLEAFLYWRSMEEQDPNSRPLTTMERALLVAGLFLRAAQRKGDQELVDRFQSVLARWGAQAADPAVEAEALSFLQECLEAIKQAPDFTPEPEESHLPPKAVRLRPQFSWKWPWR